MTSLAPLSPTPPVSASASTSTSTHQSITVHTTNLSTPAATPIIPTSTPITPAPVTNVPPATNFIDVDALPDPPTHNTQTQISPIMSSQWRRTRALAALNSTSQSPW